MDLLVIFTSSSGFVATNALVIFTAGWSGFVATNGLVIDYPTLQMLIKISSVLSTTSIG